MPESPQFTVRQQSNRVSYISQSGIALPDKPTRKSLGASAPAKGVGKGSVIYESIIQTHDLRKFFERVKILPEKNQMIICHEKIKFQQKMVQEYFEEIEYQNELNDRFLSMLTHLQKEFISGEVDSEEELRELKRQLSVTVKKFENEIKRARWTYDHIRGTLEKGNLVPISETNYAEFD
jgi:hypothetical protein